MSWTTFIETAPAADHAVQVYDGLDELVASVGRYFDAGFRAGEPAIAIATTEHWEHFARELEARGWDPVQLQEQGLLTYRDADETLATFESPEQFEPAVGGLLDEIATRFPERTIRAFGEMVEVLWRRGRQQEAIALEHLWNELARTRRFALLCGYHLDIFDVGVQADALPDVFRAHTHAQPTVDASRLAAAVDHALAEVVGSKATAGIYLDIADHVPPGALPRAQVILMWLSTKHTPVAESILDRVRSNYERLGMGGAGLEPATSSV